MRDAADTPERHPVWSEDLIGSPLRSCVSHRLWQRSGVAARGADHRLILYSQQFPFDVEIVGKALVDRLCLSLLLRMTPPRVFSSQPHGEVVHHPPGKPVCFGHLADGLGRGCTILQQRL